MCLAVYLASDQAVPLIKGDKKHRGITISLLKGDESRVRDKFSYPGIYYVGSHAGCGCGFLKDGVAGKEFEATQADYRALADILAKALAMGAHVELYACWEGDQSQPTIRSIEITLDELVKPEFELQEKVHYQLIK